MCLGGRSTPPPPPPPPSPRPPRVLNTQTSVKPAESTGDKNTTGNVENIRKGRKVLRIPLLSGAGTGVQISN
jgi:hypothetical protein